MPKSWWWFEDMIYNFQYFDKAYFLYSGKVQAGLFNLHAVFVCVSPPFIFEYLNQ
jgi:hypothetical protein